MAHTKVQNLDVMGADLENVNRHYRTSEEEMVPLLLSQINFSAEMDQRVRSCAEKLVKRVRTSHEQKKSLDKLLTKYDLSSPEGLALMGLAESLIRVPDQSTSYALVEDKLGRTNFSLESQTQDSLQERIAYKVLNLASVFLSESENGILKPLKAGLQTISKPVVAFTAQKIVARLAGKFVMANDIQGAYKLVPAHRAEGYTHSFDMLGEEAHTKEAADRYFQSYLSAIHEIGQRETVGTMNDVSLKSENNEGELEDSSPKEHELIAKQKSSISVKLSALHPRYEHAKRDTCVPELIKIVKSLCLAAYQNQIDLTIDAEESERLELSLEVFTALALDHDLQPWDGLGLAVQAYQKRAGDVIDYLQKLAAQSHRRFKVRLVKGAYWDTEIKTAQLEGLSDYPVFTRKQTTDLSYIVCAQKLLADTKAFYPQFATHNAQTVARVLEIARSHNRSAMADYEFQCLFGMGQALYDELLKDHSLLGEKMAIRIYAPVGHYTDLLPYLVRRMLENGANTSFVNEITKPENSLEQLVGDPIDDVKKLSAESYHHPEIPLPKNMFQDRKNALGLDVTCSGSLSSIKAAQKALEDHLVKADLKSYPLISGASKRQAQNSNPIMNPATGEAIGVAFQAGKEEALEALTKAHDAKKRWAHTPTVERARILDAIADAYESHMTELMAVLTMEAGKSIPDGIAEVREAVDFCRYYANEARRLFVNPVDLPGPTGEKNTLSYGGRGPFLCISPWNFPLAIFTGQIVAALVAGNPVLAKPASQTSAIATKAVELMLKAGIPGDVLHLLPASGRMIGETILQDQRLSGICFTGSTATARTINQTLAARSGPMIPFIAETGGQNAMIVDSTALPEQVVSDVIASAFQSAGQRCSALRLLCLQDDIADTVIHMLKGAMQTLTIGDPRWLKTDVGPIIDEPALKALKQHQKELKGYARELHTVSLDSSLRDSGYFCPPMAYEIPNLDRLTEEHFGPILHVVRFKSQNLSQLVEDINNLGFGLTFGLHTRIQKRVIDVSQQIDVGNVYVNRNMIGAVVGVQPFGGQGLSGTGPKAGGPNYLLRFIHEKTISVDTTAQGGNTTLMSLSK